MLGTLRPQAPNELVGLGPMLRKGGGRLPEDCGVGREEDASGWRLLAAGQIANHAVTLHQQSPVLVDSFVVQPKRLPINTLAKHPGLN